MQTFYCNENSIIIEEEKRKFFSKDIKKIREEIFLDDINEVCRQEYQGRLEMLNVYYGKNNMEVLLFSDKCMNLEYLYNFLLDQKEKGRIYKFTKFDIETVL